MKRLSRVGALCALSVAMLATERPASSAQDFEIPVVLPVSGNSAFLGQGEQQGLQIAEKVINQQGGINGSPVRFVFHDDQSSPQTAVQLTSRIVAEHPSVIIGSAIVAMCNAMAPLVTTGPVMYCLSPGIHPKSGSFVFSGFISTKDEVSALITYFRDRGLTRLAMITSTDASGQDGAAGIREAMKASGNEKLTLVAAPRFNPSDVSVAAQIEQIKAAQPQALIVWTSGAPFGTVLKGIVQDGLDVPVGTTDANMTLAQMRQYATFMPSEMLFMSSEWPPHTASLKLPVAVDKAQADMFSAYKAAGVSPDVAVAHSWDVGMLEIDALRKLGLKASSEQIRAYIAAQTNWAGINGIYNFVKTPQRGLDVSDSVVTRWSTDKKTWTIVSNPGGAPI